MDGAALAQALSTWHTIGEGDPEFTAWAAQVIRSYAAAVLEPDRVARALKASLEAHEAEITFAYSKGHHYGGEVSVADVAKGLVARLRSTDR